MNSNFWKSEKKLMKASVSADKIDVLERDVDKTRIQIVRDRILEIRQRIVDVIIRKPKEEGENSTKSTGKDQKDVGDQRHRCCCDYENKPKTKIPSQPFRRKRRTTQPIRYTVKFKETDFETRKRGIFKYLKKKCFRKHKYSHDLKVVMNRLTNLIFGKSNWKWKMVYFIMKFSLKKWPKIDEKFV